MIPSWEFRKSDFKFLVEVLVFVYKRILQLTRVVVLFFVQVGVCRASSWD